MSGGFFRGTSADQDTRFSNKQAKLMKSQKFAAELENLVDMTKVKIDVMKPWIAKRVTELIGFEDEVLINFIYGLLEGKAVNGKQLQISLTGFMERNTGKFMKELWTLLLSAQQNASGVPQQFLDEKEEETKKKKAETDRIANEIQKKREKDQEFDREKNKMDGDGEMSRDRRTLELNVKHDPIERTDEKARNKRNAPRRRSRGSLSSDSDRRSLSPRRNRSTSPTKSSNSRGYSGRKRSSRSISGTPPVRNHSISPDRRRRPSPRRSVTPRRRHMTRRSPSPVRNRTSYSRRRSSSRGRRRSPSPSRYRVRSPLRYRSRSPIRRRSRSPVWRRSRSPVRRSPLRYRSRSPLRRRSPSPVRRRSPSPVRRRSLSPVSPSPVRRRSLSPVSPSPVRRRSLSPVSPSPVRRRSPSPVRPRSSSPARSISTSPVGGRSESPVHSRLSPQLLRRSPSPDRRKSPSPVRRRSPSPSRRRRPSLRRQSPSPVRRRYQRSPLTPRRHSISPVRRGSSIRDQKRSLTTNVHRSPSPLDSSSPSGTRRSSHSPTRRVSPRRSARSPVQSPGQRVRNNEKRVPDRRTSPIVRDERLPKNSNGSKALERRPVVSMRSLQRDGLDRGDLHGKDRDSLSMQKSSVVSDGSRNRSYGGGGRSISPRRSPQAKDTEELNYRSSRKISPMPVRHKELLDTVEIRGSVDGSKSRKTHNDRQSDKGDHKENRERQQLSTIDKDSGFSERGKESYADRGRANDKNRAQLDERKGDVRVSDLEELPMLSRKSVQNDNNGSIDSLSKETDERSTKVKEKRKHKKSDKHKDNSDDYSSYDSQEERKEAKRRRKGDKKSKKEERRRRREERRRRKEERRAEKLKSKSADVASSSSDTERDHSEDESDRRKNPRTSTIRETDSEQKKLEIELREKALESLRARKGIGN